MVVNLRENRLYLGKMVVIWAKLVVFAWEKWMYFGKMVVLWLCLSKMIVLGQNGCV